jgi:hypothetical protein
MTGVMKLTTNSLEHRHIPRIGVPQFRLSPKKDRKTKRKNQGFRPGILTSL